VIVSVKRLRFPHEHEFERSDRAHPSTLRRAQARFLQPLVPTCRGIRANRHMNLFQQPANALVIMTKVPQPSRSKTRLVPPLSYDEAADLARALLVDQLENLAQFDGARLFIAFTPEKAAGFFEGFITQGFTCFPQRGQSLGDRMSHAFGHLFANAFQNIILIGSDLPALPLALFDQAYALLDKSAADVVLGPSADGGYYLVGMNRMNTTIFDGIGWSRHDVLAQTIQKVDDLGLKLKLLPQSYDIDTADDLERLQSERSRRDVLMKNTFALLNELKQRGKL
jgi:rSAM/selenodomain-associated transferase 1